MSYFSPHLQRVATLPCENIKNSKILARYHCFALLLTKLSVALNAKMSSFSMYACMETFVTLIKFMTSMN